MLRGGKQAFPVTGPVRQAGCPWAGKRGTQAREGGSGASWKEGQREWREQRVRSSQEPELLGRAQRSTDCTGVLGDSGQGRGQAGTALPENCK